eukprot:215324_1
MSTWAKLMQCPFTGMDTILNINDHEFVMVNSTVSKGFQIYKYNINNNAWNLIKFISDEKQIFSSSIAFNSSNRSIYIKNSSNELLTFALSSKSIERLSLNSIGEIELIDGMQCIHDSLHLFSYSLHDYSQTHFIFDTKSESSEQIYQFNFNNPFLWYAKDEISMIFDTFNNIMYEFQKCNKWVQYEVESMPCLESSPSIVGTKNKEYLIFMGGLINHNFSDYIFVFNMKQKQFCKSTIKCPFKGNCVATIMETNYMELLTFGFVNQCFQQSEFKDLQRLPYYIKKFMAQWISNEWIYLVEKSTRKHWKIHVDTIIQSSDKSSLDDLERKKRNKVQSTTELKKKLKINKQSNKQEYDMNDNKINKSPRQKVKINDNKNRVNNMSESPRRRQRNDNIYMVKDIKNWKFINNKYKFEVEWDGYDNKTWE